MASKISNELISCLQGKLGNNMNLAESEAMAADFISVLPMNKQVEALGELSNVQAPEAIKAGNILAARQKENEIIMKYQALQKKLVHNRNSAYLRTRAAHLEENNVWRAMGKLAPLSDMLAGSNDKFPGTGRNLDNTMRAIQSELFGQHFFGKLEEEGLLKYIQGSKGGLGSADRAAELHVANAIHELTGGAKAPKDTPTWAKQIAEIVNENHKIRAKMYQDLGVPIRDMKGFIGHVAHNPYRLLAPRVGNLNKLRMGGAAREGLAKRQWIRFVAPRLDLVKMNLTADKLDDVLSDIYDNLTAHNPAQHGANIADDVMGRTVLHWKTPKAQVEYTNTYGYGDFFTNMAFSIERDATNLAALEWLGPNPQQMLERHIAEAGLNKNDSSAVSVLRSYYREYTGGNSIAANNVTASVGTVVRGAASAALLDGSFFTYMLDVPIRSAIMRDMGNGRIRSAAQSMLDAFRLLTSEKQKIVARACGYIRNGVHGSVGRGIGATDGMGGLGSSINQLVQKYNLANYWTNKQKSGMLTAMAGMYGDLSGKAFVDIPPDARVQLERFGIGEKEWNTIRSEGLLEIDGEKFLVPENIKDDLTRRRYREFLTDRVNTGVITPSLRARSFVTGGAQRGTVVGEIARFSFQFLSFGYTFNERMTVQAGRGEAGKSYRYAFMGELAASLLVASYVTYAMREILFGREIPDLTDPVVQFTVLSRSGIAGLYGDFILQAGFNPYSREEGLDLGELISPPAFDVIQNATTFNMKGLERAFPGADHPFAPVLSYIFVNSLKEAMNPGYADKKASLAAKYGRPYIDSPLNIADPRRSLLEDLTQ